MGPCHLFAMLTLSYVLTSCCVAATLLSTSLPATHALPHQPILQADCAHARQHRQGRGLQRHQLPPRGSSSGSSPKRHGPLCQDSGRRQRKQPCRTGHRADQGALLGQHVVVQVVTRRLLWLLDGCVCDNCCRPSSYVARVTLGNASVLPC